MIYFYYFYVFTKNDDLQMILMPFSSNTTGTIRGPWTTAGYHSKAPEFTPVFIGVCDAQSLGFSVMFCESLFFILSFFSIGHCNICRCNICHCNIWHYNIWHCIIWHLICGFRLPFGAFDILFKNWSLSKVFNWSFVSNPLHTSLFQSVHFQPDITPICIVLLISEYTLENTEGAITNRQSRETGITARSH